MGKHHRAARHQFAASGQVARLGLQPLADDASALLAIIWPAWREPIVDNIVAIDAERVLNDLGGQIAVVAADGSFQQVIPTLGDADSSWRHDRNSCAQATI